LVGDPRGWLASTTKEMRVYPMFSQQKCIDLSTC
jgi:hypothetical protein